jgi:hypothetical protein
VVFVREMELRYTACAVFVLLFCAKKTLVSLLFSMAGTTGLEPATSAVTGQRSNQLSYVPFCKLLLAQITEFAVFRTVRPTTCSRIFMG